MKILLISNSFGVNLQTYAFQIAKSNHLDLHVYTLYIGGCSLETHDKNIKENNNFYELFIDGKSSGNFVSINDILKREKWDYISLQQASHLSGIFDSYYPYFNNIYTYIKKECPKSKIMFHKTWAYSCKNLQKFNAVKNSLASFKFVNPLEMNFSIDACLSKIQRDFNIDLIIDSNKVVYDGMQIFDDLYDSEGFHLNNLGCYLIGLNFIKTLFNKPIKAVFSPEELKNEEILKAVNYVNRHFDILKRIKKRGRFISYGEKIEFYNVNSGVSFDVKGDSFKFEITSKHNDGYFYVIKDHDYAHKKKRYLKKDRTLYCEYFLPDENIHHYDILKANEANDNSLLIGNFDCVGVMNYLHKNKEKFVQVYGDSSIAGFGILSHEGEANIHTNDGVLNFCFRSIYSLNYDYDIFAFSGWGLTFSEYTNPKEDGIEKYVDNITVNSNKKWKKHRADLLIISLGTNDQYYIQENSENSRKLTGIFMDSYKKLIEKERENNDKMPVLMLYGSLKETHAYDLIEKTYDFLAKSLKNIYILKLNGDNSAISNHSYKTYQKRMSKQLVKQIKMIL